MTPQDSAQKHSIYSRFTFGIQTSSVHPRQHEAHSQATSTLLLPHHQRKIFLGTGLFSLRKWKSTRGKLLPLAIQTLTALVKLQRKRK